MFLGSNNDDIGVAGIWRETEGLLAVEERYGVCLTCPVSVLTRVEAGACNLVPDPKWVSVSKFTEV